MEKKLKGQLNPINQGLVGSVTFESQELVGNITFESQELVGNITPESQRVLGSLTPKSQRLVGNLNIYTMETGDGREIELAVVDNYICWRRFNDISWIQLVPLSALKGESPIKGIDYWTEEDKADILEYINAGIGNDIPHNNLLDRDAPNAHPISAISGLQEELNSKATINSESIVAGGLMVASPDGSGIECCGHTIDDIAMKSDLNPDKTYIHIQRVASDLWTITHNLNKMPSVTIVDSAGTVVNGEINYIDMNNLILKFSGAFSGKAFMN